MGSREPVPKYFHGGTHLTKERDRPADLTKGVPSEGLLRQHDFPLGSPTQTAKGIGCRKPSEATVKKKAGYGEQHAVRTAEARHGRAQRRTRAGLTRANARSTLRTSDTRSRDEQPHKTTLPALRRGGTHTTPVCQRDTVHSTCTKTRHNGVGDRTNHHKERRKATISEEPTRHEHRHQSIDAQPNNPRRTRTQGDTKSLERTSGAPHHLFLFFVRKTKRPGDTKKATEDGYPEPTESNIRADNKHSGPTQDTERKLTNEHD